MTIHVICVILILFHKQKNVELSPGGHFLVNLGSLASDQAGKSCGWVSEIRITS